KPGGRFQPPLLRPREIADQLTTIDVMLRAADPTPATRGAALRSLARFAQCLTRAVHNPADEVVLRLDQPVGHLQGRVDNVLPPGRMLVAERRQPLIDGIDELADRLDRGPLPGLERLEYIIGELGSPVNCADLLA